MSASNDDFLFAQEAQALGYVSQAQVDEGLKLQQIMAEQLKIDERLAVILVKRGWLAEEQARLVEAQDRQPLERGHAYVARGDHHLRIERSSGQLKCRLTQDELVSGHRPSVDVLFQSVANVAGPLAVGAILTGMGRDGAHGLREMREAGAYTVGQSASSALVYGMPRVAFEEGAVVEQAPLEAVAARLVAALNRLKSAA